MRKTDLLFFGSSPDTQQGRGSSRVGALSSLVASFAWRATTPNNLYIDFGSRVIAFQMLATDPNVGGVLHLFQISAYAPTSYSHQTHITHLENALALTIA